MELENKNIQKRNRGIKEKEGTCSYSLSRTDWPKLQGACLLISKYSMWVYFWVVNAFIFRNTSMMSKVKITLKRCC